MKASIPSFLSDVFMTAMDRERSWAMAEVSPTSNVYLTARFVYPAAIYDFEAMVFAKAIVLVIIASVSG